MTPKKCMTCDKFVKLKQFEELRSKFNNWCDKFQRPVALCKCKGSEIAIKYLETNKKEVSNLNENNAYEILKINFHHF